MLTALRLAALPLIMGGWLTIVPPPVSAGGGCHGSPTPDAIGTEVVMAANCFSPAVLRVQPGDRVSFRNTDNALHVVAGYQWGSEGELRQNEASVQRFDEPGTYAFACHLHPGMVGTIVVGDGKTTRVTVPSPMSFGKLPAPMPAPAAVDVVRVTDRSVPWVGALGGVLGLLAGAVIAAGATYHALRPRA